MLENVKKEFPIFKNNKGMVFLDTAASAQKPKIVIDGIKNFYENDYANIHRGMYSLSERSTNLYDNSKEVIKDFINANSTEEIVFTKGTTDSINLLAYSFGKLLKKGDRIIISCQEHNSNFVPWQEVAKEKGIKLDYVKIKKDGLIDLKDLKGLLKDKTKLVALSALSNVYGVNQPIDKITTMVHKNSKAKVFLDMAQYILHSPVDVKKLDVDFMAFSAHKLYGPSGIGILYGKKELLDELPPYQTGGGSIISVCVKGAEFLEGAEKFEAGTPNIAGAVGFTKAIEFVKSIGYKNIQKHNKELISYTIKKLSKIKDVDIIGGKSLSNRQSPISFVMMKYSSYDVSTLMANMNICIRAGRHCTDVLHDALNISSSMRISFGVYTDKEDIDKFIIGLEKAIKMLG